MSALADALVAAQRRALGQLEKAYVAGAFEDDRMREMLDAMGCADAVDQDYLIQALDVIRTYGGPLPSMSRENGAPKEPEAMSEAQASYIDKLWQERGGNPGDKPILAGLTKDAASKLISQLKTNTYNVADWDIPF